MTQQLSCAGCQELISGSKILLAYKGADLWLCQGCASMPLSERQRILQPAFREIDQADAQRRAEEEAAQYRTDVPEEQLESLLLHAFLDLIGERKAAGRRELAATHETIATWLTDRTTLAVKPQHVQYLTLGLRDGNIIDVGGGGIGRPNTYDTRENAMGLDAFWDQVDAFLMVWRMPNRRSLLRKEDAARPS